MHYVMHYHDAAGRVGGELFSILKNVADVTLWHILQVDLVYVCMYVWPYVYYKQYIYIYVFMYVANISHLHGVD